MGHLPLEAVTVKRLTETATVPTRAHEHDAGWDLYADKSVHLSPGLRAIVSTGVSIAVPQGFVGMVCPRSGYAAKYGVTVLNAPGIIDAGYRGEIKVILQHCMDVNYGQSLRIERGDRIAQLVIAPISTKNLIEVDELDNTERGDGGFGSSGH